MFKVILVSLAMLCVQLDAFAVKGTHLSFQSKAELAEVKAGKITTTFRLHDRTLPPYNYKLGLVLPLTNRDKSEDARNSEEQAAALSYGSIVVTSLQVKIFSEMSAEEKIEALRYHLPANIEEAKGVFTVVGFRFL